MELVGRTVVITGASSGVGRATAVELSRRACNVVLAGRREAALAQTAAMCESATLVCATDVTIEEDVARLTERALARFGKIDGWVNNAGVTLYAPLAEAPLKEHVRVLETNLIGAMICARAVIPEFRRRHAGVMVNIGSVLSHVGQPFVPSYTISKFGLRGMTQALRVELADEPDIHICDVFPFALDTPHFETGANRMGRAARAIPPMQSPEKVARAIADVLEHPRRTRFVPPVIALGVAFHAIAPSLAERLLLAALRRWHFAGTQASTDGDLYRSAAQPATMHGHRPPLISTPSFAAWLVGALGKIEVARLRERFR